MKAIIIITNTINNVIQIGDNTHTHDHVILFSSFSAINIIVNSPTNPIPPLELELFLLFISTFLSSVLSPIKK